MLNLNYNLLGTIQKGEFKGPVSFEVRNDPFSASIVLAMPGSIFKNGAYQNQFGMVDEFSDISSYVRGGVNLPPSGSNLQTYVSTSGNGIAFATSSLVKFTTPSERYQTSLYLESTSSVVINKLWPAYQGANLNFTSSFTIETWVAFTTTASASGTSFTPDRLFVYKYDPAVTATSAYLWYGSWGGDIGGPYISGSSRFVYDYDSPTGGDEVNTYGTGSLPVVPNQWNHYAVSYSNNVFDGFYNRKLKIYINGLKIAERTIAATGQEVNQDINELLQVMGALDGSDRYVGSPAYFQDFRIYNGTDKNYTGSIIPLPQSMVRWPI